LTEVQPAPQARPGTAVLAWDVTNLGVTPAQDVVVTFTFPAGPTLGGGNVATSPCTAGPVTGPTSCPFARPLNPSEALVATLVLDTAAVPAGTRLSVQASVASSTPDPNPANNVSTITFLVPGQGPATTAPPGLVATGGGPISPILAVALVMVGIGLVVAAREGTAAPPPECAGRVSSPCVTPVPTEGSPMCCPVASALVVAVRRGCGLDRPGHPQRSPQPVRSRPGPGLGQPLLVDRG
jgi:hypothetical protein